jgi:hypothetical protein
MEKSVNSYQLTVKRKNQFMNTKNFLLIATLLLSQIADAQTMFQKHYGGQYDDGGGSVLQTDDGGYIVAAQTFSFGTGTSDIYIIKTDAFGNEIWSKVYGGNGWDAPFGIIPANNTGYIIVAQTSSFGAGASDAFLMKISLNGDSVWFKTYGGIKDDGANSIDICTDSGFIICGTTCSYSNVFSAAYLIKTNSNGDTIWTRTYEEKDYNNASSIITTHDGGFLLAGIAETGGALGADGLVIRTNSNGDTLWMKIYGGLSYDNFSSVCEDNNGNFLLCGTTYNLVSGSYDAYILKINSNGQELWSKTYGGFDVDNAGSIKHTNDNAFIIAGSTESYGVGGKDVLLLKIDQNGDTLWSKTFGGTSDDVAGSVRQTNDNGFIITGYTKSFSANSDVYLIKTDANGYSGFEKIININKTLAVFPNPSNGLFYIKIPESPISNPIVEVYNIQGQRIFENQFFGIISDKIEINIRNNSKGIYIICIKNNNYYKSSKIVIN